MKIQLTDAKVRGLKPGQTLMDTEVRGFGARNQRGSKSLFIRARGPSGQRYVTIGEAFAPADIITGVGFKAGKLVPPQRVRVSSLDVAQARREALRIRDAIKAGRDPQQKSAPEEAETYEAVVDRFISQYAKPRQRTWKETERVLKATPWKDRPFAEITSKDADKYLGNLVEAGKKASARAALAWIKTLWRWAWRRHLVDFPAMDALLAEDFGITKKPRERFYSDDEIKALWNAQSDALTARESGFLRLSILLGVRGSALAGMHKSELDSLKEPTIWTVPTARTKTRKSREEEGRVYLIPIVPLARSVLLPLLKGADDLVFPSTNNRGIPMTSGTQLAKKVRDASGVGDWRHHAHRHTIATWLQNQGHDEYDRALVLQHAGAGTVTGGYSHGYSLDRLQKLLEKWAKHVEEVAAIPANL